MHRLSTLVAPKATGTRTVARCVSLLTPFLPGHTRYSIIQVLERLLRLAC